MTSIAPIVDTTRPRIADTRAASSATEIFVAYWPLPTHRATTALIFDERFNIEYDGGEVLLTHPQWSLFGAGISLEAATKNLFAEACDLSASMRQTPDALSPEATRLRDYVLRIAIAHAA